VVDHENALAACKCTQAELSKLGNLAFAEPKGMGCFLDLQKSVSTGHTKLKVGRHGFHSATSTFGVRVAHPVEVKAILGELNEVVIYGAFCRLPSVSRLGFIGFETCQFGISFVLNLPEGRVAILGTVYRVVNALALIIYGVVGLESVERCRVVLLHPVSNDCRSLPSTDWQVRTKPALAAGIHAGIGGICTGQGQVSEDLG
jgi:hypothetical protein